LEVTLNLNERIPKLLKSTRPFGTRVDETNFFTPSKGITSASFTPVRRGDLKHKDEVSFPR
jgi:hypothetical protein